MALDSVIRSAVGIAHKITRPVQVLVSHQAWIGWKDDAGTPDLAPAVLRPAIWERKSKVIRQTISAVTGAAQEVVARHYLTFLEPIEANGAADRKEPLDERDVLTLPDGTTGPIVDLQGNRDSIPYLFEVWLG